MRWSQALTRHKSIAQLQQEAGARRDLRRVLGIWQLTAIGIGGIIGVGIFVLAGQQAAVNAGPAVFISFLIAGVASAAAALCYAEFAGLIPVTGSAYTYGYAVLGEFAAWVIGWDLLLEYALIVAVVAIGWSGYVQALLGAAGVHLPDWAQGAISSDALAYYWDRAAMWVGFTLDHPAPRPTGGHVFNVIAAAVSLGIAGLLTIGTEWGARFNTTVVAIKVIGVALVIVAGVYYVNPANWHPFVPPRVVIDGVGHFGWQGVLAAASVVFFAVFGYDTLTTAAEESRDPQRDLPRAVLLSLGISMALYLAISLVLTGMVPYQELNSNAPVASAFAAVGAHWVMVAISIAAIAGITSVLFAFMLAAARIWFALARDGLLPAWFARTHPRWRTPYRPTLILGAGTALLAGFLPIGELAEMVNIGTLSAFIIICASIIVLRVRRPELERRFRTPLVPWIPLIGIVFSAVLIWGLQEVTYWRFIVWMALGLWIYFGYGIKRSALARGAADKP